MDVKRVISKARLPGPAIRKAGSKSSSEGNPSETIQARLERKAAVADETSIGDESLGTLSPERRHALLFGR